MHCEGSGGISLIFSIISGISFGLSLVGNIFDGNDSEVLEDVLELVEIEDNINVLDISVTSSNILIKVGDTFKIDTDNKYIDYKQDGKKFKVTEKDSADSFHTLTVI